MPRCLLFGVIKKIADMALIFRNIDFQTLKLNLLKNLESVTTVVFPLYSLDLY